MANPDDDSPTPRTDIQPHGRDATSPIVRLVVEREHDPADYALAQKLRQSGSDTATILARFIRAIEAREHDSAERLENDLGAAIKKQDADLVALRAEVADIKRTANTASWIVKGILGAVSLFAVYVLDRVVTRVERDGEQTVKMQWLEKRVEHLEAPRPSP